MIFNLTTSNTFHISKNKKINMPKILLSSHTHTYITKFQQSVNNFVHLPEDQSPRFLPTFPSLIICNLFSKLIIFLILKVFSPTKQFLGKKSWLLITEIQNWINIWEQVKWICKKKDLNQNLKLTVFQAAIISTLQLWNLEHRNSRTSKSCSSSINKNPM